MEYLDIVIDMSGSSFAPYTKDNTIIKYVHTGSDHPKHILEHITKSLENRLSILSSSENIFCSSIGPYQQAINEAVYTNKLKYTLKVIRDKKNTEASIWLGSTYHGVTG